MPYKFNESRRHKIPKPKYRITNWAEYDAALMRRGSVTVWFTEEAVEAWHAPATGGTRRSAGIFGDRYRDQSCAPPRFPSAAAPNRRSAAIDCRGAPCRY